MKLKLVLHVVINFLFKLCHNGDARQVVGRLQRATRPLCNFSHNFIGITTIAQSGSGSTSCNECRKF